MALLSEVDKNCVPFLAHEIQTVMESRDLIEVPAKIAAMLESWLVDDRLLSEEDSRTNMWAYRQNVLHTAADQSFSIAANVFLPGQGTPIHDDTTWRVFGVFKGQLSEQRFALEPVKGPNVVRRRRELTHDAGDVVVLPPKAVIHQFHNAGPERLVCVTVYGRNIKHPEFRRYYRDVDFLEGLDFQAISKLGCSR